ncbi:MAG: hypothetical protein WC942_08975 [Clostridia bacterium]|jgi:hypothetical protein
MSAVQDFKNLEDGFLKFARNHFQYIKSGSSRSVFRISKRRVVKIAINQIGLEQNKVEWRISQKKQNWPYITKAIYKDKNYNWVISEFANNSITNTKVNKAMYNFGEFISKYKLSVDLEKPSSWGIKGKRAVVLDYGAPISLLQKYY